MTKTAIKRELRNVKVLSGLPLRTSPNAHMFRNTKVTAK